MLIPLQLFCRCWLQNGGHLLPLDKSNNKLKIALIGAGAVVPCTVLSTLRHLDLASASPRPAVRTDAHSFGRLRRSFARLSLSLSRDTAGSGSVGVPNSNVAVTPLEAFTNLGFDTVYDPANSTAFAAAAAASADVAIVFGSAHLGEGHDGTDLLFVPPSGTGSTVEDMILAVAKAQKKTVVVAACPGQILTDWRTEVASILVPFLPGEHVQYGNFDIVLGHFSRIFQLHTAPHLPCDVIYLVPMFIGCWLALSGTYNPMLRSISVVKVRQHDHRHHLWRAGPAGQAARHVPEC